jgi:LacI family transcriptional regulator
MVLQQDKVEGQQPGARRAGTLAKRATIRDVAREAGVGIGMVSRVLSGRAPVAPATRARVEAAMRKLGYHPSRAAQALSRRRTNTIAVVVPLFTRYFYVEVLRGIEEALDKTGYALVIHSVERAADRDRAFGDLVESQRADGALIVSLAPDSALIESLRALHLPAVLIDSSHPALPSVVVDHQRAAAEATRHLLRLGHRRVALIDRKEDPFSPEAASARIPGYRRALAEAAIPWRADYEVIVDFTPEGGQTALRSLLALPEPPTAVFAGSDTQALGVLEAAREAGLRVPGDLAIVGYNDIEVARYVGLTTMRVPMREMGHRGAELLLRALDLREVETVHLRFDAELVVRRTCGGNVFWASTGFDALG